MPPKAPPPFVVNKKLVLHFDLDNVIMLYTRQKEQLVMKLVAESAWGKPEQKDAKSPFVWKLQSTNLSKTAPPQTEGLISYADFLEQQYPKTQGPNLENQKIKADLLANFHKGPGLKIKGEVDKLLKSITVPKTLQEFIKSEAESKEQMTPAYRILVNTLVSTRYQILPSFFKLLLSLKKAKRQFAIVLHADEASAHQDIIKELNLFFMGQHPLYNGKNGTPLNKFDGSKGCKNFKLSDKSCAVTYRYEQPFTGDAATFGTKRIYKEKDLEGLKHKLLQSKAETRLCVGSEIYSYSHILLRQSASIYLIDRLKMMMVDPVDYNTQEIYFHIGKIEVMSCLGQLLENTEGKMSYQVDLFELLKDVDYFIKALDVCQKNRAAEIEKIEKGGEEEPVQKQQKIEVESLSDAEYLKQTIFPLLDGALRLVDIERPEDPIAVIALYCLKNKHRIKKPEKIQPTN